MIAAPRSSDPTVRALLVDGALLGACIALMLAEQAVGGGFGLTAPGAAATVLAAAPVLLRRHRPALAFASAMLLIFAVLSIAGIYNTVAFPAMVCGYALADRRGRVAAIVAAATAMPTVLLMLQVYSPHPMIGWDTVKNLGFVAVPLALGIASHEHRAYRGALVERAESAERTREEEALRRVSEERLRIARDVHDVVAHAMVAINVQAGVGAHLLDRDPEQARRTLRDIKGVSGRALTDLRAVLGLLRDGAPATGPPEHPTQGMTRLHELGELLAAAGLDVAVRVDPAVADVPATVDATGYRIVQEALTNVMRHVGPTAVSVRVAAEGDAVAIDVVNDPGFGPPPENGQGTGNGLRGIRERAEAVGGSVTAGPRDGGGWRVTASLPVAAP